jgi:hypothetical protein
LSGLAITGASCLCLLLLFLPLSGAFALDLGEWLPGLKVSPFLSERVQYESNVFQAPSHAQSDVVFKTIPGFLADYAFGPHSLSAGYRAEILNWVELRSQDTVHHIAVGQLKLDFPRLLVNLRDDFARTSDPPGSELTGRIQSTTNVLAPESEYRLTERFAVGANYSWTHVRFDDDFLGQLLDRDEHLTGASVFWRIRPKTDARLSYSYTRKNFTQAGDRDVAIHAVTLGLRGDLTAKLSSTFRVGFQTRDPQSGVAPGYTGLILGGDWIFRPTEHTTITLMTDRSVQESSFGDTPYYVTSNASLEVQQQFGSKLTGTVRVGGGINEYPSKQTIGDVTDWRSDTFFAAGATVEYQIQPWLLVGVEYTHTFRRSNFDTFDYQDDKVVAKVTLQF